MAGFLFATSLLALAFWLLLSLDRARRFPRNLFLERGGRGEAHGRVAVIVPARDEADVLPLTLPSLLGQTWEAMRVVVVDDGSDDDTSEVAAEIGKSGLRSVHVLRTAGRPEGWVGKVYALEQGRLHLATSEPPDWVLLTDADIVHRPDSVELLLAKADAGRYDMVSVMARLHAGHFWERVVIPAFVFFFHLLYPFARVQRRSSKVVAAAGGCVLLRWQMLEKIGGFEVIRQAVIDDVSLARAVAGAGGRVWLGLDPQIASARPYEGLDGLWKMVARSAFTQLQHRWSLVWLVVVGLFAVIVSPPLVLAAAAVFRLATGDTPDPLIPAAWAAAATWLLEAIVMLPWVRHHRVPVVYAFSLPLAGVLYAAMTVGSAWAHQQGRGATWKGRSYG